MNRNLRNATGLCPAPHSLFEKSETKTLTLKPKILRMQDFSKVLMKLFQKFLGLGAKPQGLKLIQFLALGFLLTACTTTYISTTPPPLLEPVATRIDTAVVTRGQVSESVRFFGMVRQESVPVNFGPVAANIGQFYVRPGDSVTEGQLLARLDSYRLDEQIAQQEERIARLRRELNLDNAIREIDIEIMILEHRNMVQRVAETLSEDAFDAAQRREIEIDRAKLELSLAQDRQAMTMRQEETTLANLRNSRAGLNLYAPFAGVVTNVTNLSWVPSFADVLYIAPLDSQVFVEYFGIAAFPAGRHGRIIGHSGGQEYELTRMFLTREQTLFYRDIGIRLPVRFAFEGAADDENFEKPPVGAMFAIHAYSHFQEDVLRIPRNALLAAPEYGFFVYRLEDGMLTQVIITIGVQTSTYVSVLSGLEEGDVVYVR